MDRPAWGILRSWEGLDGTALRERTPQRRPKPRMGSEVRTRVLRSALCDVCMETFPGAHEGQTTPRRGTSMAPSAPAIVPEHLLVVLSSGPLRALHDSAAFAREE